CVTPPTWLPMHRKRPRISPTARVDLIEVLDVGEQAGATVRPNAVHWRREYFIPLRVGELRRRLAGDSRLSPDERRQFLSFCRLLSATFHYEYHERVEQLKGEYEPFDPDVGMRGPDEGSAGQPSVRDTGQLFTPLMELLERANYHKLSQSQIEQAVAAASDWGVRLNVDFTVFERLEVYARGDVIGRRVRHRWQNLYRAEEVDVPIYERLLVIFQLRPRKRLDKHLDPRAIYIKLFKNIPKEDVDMMLPGVKARLSLIDSGKILLPTLSGLAMAIYKIVLALLISTVLGAAGMLVLVGGLVMYLSRSVFGYLNTQNKYQLDLTRSLYFQSLDNSSGVLLRLTDEAEEQEFSEAVLAYFLLWQDGGEQGLPADEVDRLAEAFLGAVCGYGVDFEVDDALRKLQRLGLAVPAAEGVWRAVSIRDALRALDRAWDDYFQVD
ncbi:MAG: TMEM143 family protein, partial [Pirellulaceae bacterium]